MFNTNPEMEHITVQIAGLHAGEELALVTSNPKLFVLAELLLDNIITTEYQAWEVSQPGWLRNVNSQTPILDLAGLERPEVDLALTRRNAIRRVEEEVRSYVPTRDPRQ